MADVTRSNEADEKIDPSPAMTVQTTPKIEDEPMSEPKTKKCPEGHDMEVYEGENPHKQGTAFCDKCGTRYPVKA